jgi:molybdopterin synthase catalytic subunit
MTPLATIVREPIDPADMLRRVSAPANGAVILFLGAVRQVNDGRAVTGIDYAAYEQMALSELSAIAAEASSRFGTSDVAVEHRLGTLAVEEISVAIAVGHPHRDAAYSASRWVIEELKRRVPIWKREHYADGTREWVDPSGRPAAEMVP